MADSYTIIADQALLEEYINMLPDTTENERYYVTLFARRKYCKEIKSDRASVKRFLSHKRDLIHKIRQLECPLGSYVAKGDVATQKSLALYISANPRCMVKAAKSTCTKVLAELLGDKDNYNPHSTAMTAAHQSKSRTNFVLFDIDNYGDSKYDDLVKAMEVLIAPKVVRTRGGIHIYVPPHLQSEKSWHPQLTKALQSAGLVLDQTGDLLTPVPGCVQGNYVPNFIVR